ncbi:MAG TPA: SMP-30/gluconolactonase/LRE family protein [Terracidiphilus sp.]|nr:SMP-30/gluconolactonase/LRE family protein [Terracidiphilus sp.]
MKSSRSVCLLLILAACITLAGAVVVLHAARQATTPGSSASNWPQPLKVERIIDPALDRIIPSGAVLERVATGFEWLEGPVWANGSLYFADIHKNAIRKWTPGKGVSLFLHPSGYQGAAPYGGPEPGSNGMTLDPQGRLTVAGHAQRDIYRFEALTPGAQKTILVDSYEGKRLNSPNDLVYKSDGALYFTDPPYGLRKQNDSDPAKQLKVNGVYRIPHAASQRPGSAPQNSALQLLVSDLPRPNGIAFSPDEKYLYVDNSEPQKIWMRYRVLPDGKLADGKVFCDATSDKRRGGPDGMKVDREGNIYSAGPGGVWILSPEGRHLGTLLIPEVVGNVAWGGPDHKTLYIMATGSIYRVRLKIAGQMPPHGK